MEETIQKIASDLNTLKWLFGILAVFLFIVTVGLVSFLKMMSLAVKNTETRAEARIFSQQADTLLEEGKNKELKEHAELRLEEYPSDAWAHYYLAMALYRLNELVTAKEHFIKVGELSPHMKTAADESLEEIEAILSETKPRVV